MIYYSIDFTKEAKRDLDNIDNYISNRLFAPLSAERIIKNISKSIAKLSHMPFRRPIVHDERLADKGIRMLHVKSYIVVFIINENAKIINILRILHNRQDWHNIL